MIPFNMAIAGRVLSVSALFESTRGYCEEYLSEEDPVFSVTITTADIAYEREKSAREDALEGLPVRNLLDAQLEITALQRKIVEKLFACDTLLFHGSVVAVDGIGYLFTAKSGTGKSTHTRLWRELFGERAIMVNDDKPFLKLTEEGVIACGSPWDGKHRLSTNTCVPLKAICVLERGEANHAERISAKDALPMLLQQSQRPRNPGLLGKYLELLDRLADSVEFYRLQCNMDPEAAMVSYRAMSGKNE